MKNEESSYKKIKDAFWDYNIDPEKLYLILHDKIPPDGMFTKAKILLRLIEVLSWYEIIDLFGKEYLKQNITKELVDKIRNPILRDRYEFIRKVLHNEAISTSGWSDKNRDRLKSSILSHWRNSP
ncbi:Hypothetical protein IALB_1427 [Ignavibacterium album JCM 16511]|uniref:Uncharacterized protein n=1 Tax=Ignavibacterium album (strain DSM 19864 / JCM 16511 / NBRC 101810 / Mat9-16) TaxID=945713 RepID=I0AJI0_IGNAJ|nr:Hypothetical protein IALB_1427 [Ignavibacterium album JCM 16511]